MKYNKEDKENMHRKIDEFRLKFLMEANEKEVILSLAAFEAGFIEAMIVFKHEVMKSRES